MRQGKANDQDEQNEPITGMHGIEVFSLVEGRKGKSSGMSNEVRRGRRTSGENMARGPAQQSRWLLFMAVVMVLFVAVCI